MFLFDTDHLSVLQRLKGDDYESLRDHMRQCDSDDICLSVVSLHEQTMGANAIIQRGTRRELIRGYEYFHTVLAGFSQFRVLEFDETAARLFDELRLRARRIGTMDLRIAAIALSHDMTVLTRNARDFEQVPELKIEDWTR